MILNGIDSLGLEDFYDFFVVEFDVLGAKNISKLMFDKGVLSLGSKCFVVLIRFIDG